MVNGVTLELLAWVSEQPRTYAETIEAWKSNCPRLSAWDDACSDGLVEIAAGRVSLTPRGRALLDPEAKALAEG